jgi:hypothetical protein
VQDWTIEALIHQLWQFTRVIQMGMRQDDCIDTARIKLEVIFLDSFDCIASLMHGAFH